MKMTRSITFLMLAVAGIAATSSCSKRTVVGEEPEVIDTTSSPVDANVPPATWQEHWFEHDQLLSRVYYDNGIVLYFDDGVDRSITWPRQYLSDVWKYTRKVYGEFGDDLRLFAVFHAGHYSGGHPGTYLDAGHDYHNTIDVASQSTTAWLTGVGNDIDLTTHEIGHIVEGASHNHRESPAFNIWKDSKWMEIYQFDVYKGLGRYDDTLRWYNMMVSNVDDFPAAGSHWFRDWFYPIYTSYGGSKVLNNFFLLLSEYFPASNNVYTRSMNWGEFVHFWSGAAGVNLKPLATKAFGWPDDWETQLTAAKRDFPGITYN